MCAVTRDHIDKGNANVPIGPSGTISALLADVDGTLVTKAKVLTKRAIEAVRRLHESGIAPWRAGLRPNIAAEPHKHSWRDWLTLPSWAPSSAIPTYALASAFVLLLGFSLYQNVVTLPALRQSSAPRALSAFSFVSSGTRGATALVIAAPTRQP